MHIVISGHQGRVSARKFVFISQKFCTCTEVFPSADIMSPSTNNCHNLKIPFQIYSCSVLMFNSPYADQMLVCFVPPCCKLGLNPCKVTLLRWQYRCSLRVVNLFYVRYINCLKSCCNPNILPIVYGLSQGTGVVKQINKSP